MSQRQIKRIRKKIALSQAFRNDEREEVFFGDGFRDIVRRNKIFLLGLIGLVVGLYFNAMWGDFVSDDYATIVQNPQITNTGFMIKQFNLAPWSNFLLAKIFGVKSAIPFHVFSLIVYCLGCIPGFVFV